jgi:hypothetical protein
MSFDVNLLVAAIGSRYPWPGSLFVSCLFLLMSCRYLVNYALANYSFVNYSLLPACSRR